MRDSIDQALLAAETLPADAAALTDAARTAFDTGALVAYGLAAALVAATLGICPVARQRGRNPLRYRAKPENGSDRRS